MRSGQITHATRSDRNDYAAVGIVILVTVLFSLLAYRPFQLYFFGDTWDILCEFHEHGWRTMWRMHNEHFMPLSKALLYVQCRLFGMHNFPYQAVNIAIHAMNAALVYVAAREVTPFVVPRIYGALFFAFSGVYWELTTWEAGQQTTLALLFILLSLILGGRYLGGGSPLLLPATMLTALLASWSMGFGLLVVPLLVARSVKQSSWRRHPACRAATLGSAGEPRSPRNLASWWGGRPRLRRVSRPAPVGFSPAAGEPSSRNLAESRPKPAESRLRAALPAPRALPSHFRPWNRPLAICLLPAVTVLSGYAVLLYSDRSGLQYAISQTSLRQALQVVPWTLTALRGLAASYLAPVSAPLVLAGIFLLTGFFSPRRFLSQDRLLALLVPLSLLLLPYALSATGRVQLGMALAASSRYQYLPAAALGLILAWLAGGVFDIVESRYPNALAPLALAVLLTLTLGAFAGYEYLGRFSTMIEWGRSARRFVSLAIYQRNWANVPAGMVCVRPELYLPPGMYPHQFFDLSRALPLYAAEGVRGNASTIGIESVLGRQEITRINLLNGGARGIGPGKWKEENAASAYGFETHCTNREQPYTFAASVRLVSGDPTGACLRLVFKNASGDTVDTFPSQPIWSHDFTTVVVSAYPTPDTATVAVDFAGSAPASQPIVIAVRDAVLLQHPVYLPK